MLEKNKVHLLRLLMAGLALFQIVYACLNYREGVFADQWDLVPILTSYLNQGDWLAQVFSHHGDHFHAAAYLIMLPIAKLSEWNLLYELVAILIINVLSFFFFYKSIFSSFVTHRSDYWFTTSLLISAMYFSVAHGGNLLWTWQLAVYLVVFGLGLTVYGLTSFRSYNIGFILAVLGATIASFSFSSGFSIWPIGIFLILTQNQLGLIKRLSLCSIWGVIGLSILVLFLHDTGGSFSQGLDFSPWRSLVFLLYFLGTPLAYFSRELSLIVASIGLISFAYLVYKVMPMLAVAKSRFFYVAIALALFAIITGLLTSLGRVELGFSQARSFRYIVFSQFFWFALFALVWLRQNLDPVKMTYKKPIWGCLCFCMILTAFNAQKIGRSASKSAQVQHLFWNEFQSASPDQKNAMLISLEYPDDALIVEYGTLLKDNGMNLYRED